MNFSGSSPHSLHTRWREIQNPTTIMRTAFESVNTQVIVWTTGLTHTCYERSSRNVVCCCMSWGAIGLKTDHTPLCCRCYSFSLQILMLMFMMVMVCWYDHRLISRSISFSLFILFQPVTCKHHRLLYRVSVQFGGIRELLYMYVYGRQTKIRSRGLSVYKEEGNLHTPCH